MHWIRHRGLVAAVRDYIDREAVAVGEEIQANLDHSPFAHTGLVAKPAVELPADADATSNANSDANSHADLDDRE